MSFSNTNVFSNSSGDFATGSGVVAINSQVNNTQFLTTSTAGNEFNVTSVTGTHILNVPIVTGTNDGMLTSADYLALTGANSIKLINNQTEGTQYLTVSTNGTALEWDSNSGTHNLNIPEPLSSIRFVNDDSNGTQYFVQGSNASISSTNGTTVISALDAGILYLNDDSSGTQYLVQGSNVNLSSTSGTTTISSYDAIRYLNNDSTGTQYFIGGGNVSINTTGGTTSIIGTSDGTGYPQVYSYSSFGTEAGATAAPTGAVYVALNPEGIWLINRKDSGLYRKETAGTTSTSWKRLGNYIDTFNSQNFNIYDSVDNTKILKFDTSLINTGTTVTLSPQQSSGTTAYLSDVALKQDSLAFTGTTNNKFLRDDNTFQPIDTTTGYVNTNLYLTGTNSDVGGYKTLSYDIDPAPTTSVGTVALSDGIKTFATYLNPSNVEVTTIPSGLWVFTFYGHANDGSGQTQLGVTSFKRDSGGTETNLFTTWSESLGSSADKWIKFQVSEPSYSIGTDDRLGVRVLGTTTGTQNVGITYYVGDGYGAFLNNPNKLRHTQLRGYNDDIAYQHLTLTEKNSIGTKANYANLGTLATTNNLGTLASFDNLGTLAALSNLGTLVNTTTFSDNIGTKLDSALGTAWLSTKADLANLGTTIHYVNSNSSGTQWFVSGSNTSVLSSSGTTTISANASGGGIGYINNDASGTQYIVGTNGIATNTLSGTTYLNGIGAISTGTDYTNSLIGTTIPIADLGTLATLDNLGTLASLSNLGTTLATINTQGQQNQFIEGTRNLGVASVSGTHTLTGPNLLNLYPKSLAFSPAGTAGGRWVLGVNFDGSVLSVSDASLGHNGFQISNALTKFNPTNYATDFGIAKNSSGYGYYFNATTNTHTFDTDKVVITTAKTPSSATDTGVTGQLAWNADYFYVCTATNTWKRTALASW